MSASTRMKLLGAVAGVAAAVAVAAPAQALSYGDVTATYSGSRTPAAGNGGVFNFQRAVGGLRNDFAGTLVTNDPVGHFIGICMEVGETIGVGSHSWTVRDVADAPVASPGAMGAQRATDIAKLVTLAFNGYLANALTYNADIVAGFQLALWEISVERQNGTGGSYNISAGNGDFSLTTAGIGAFTNAQITIANGYLGQLNAVNGITAASNLLALTERGTQDMLVQTPIPAAAWLLGSGLLGLFGISRRRSAVAA